MGSLPVTLRLVIASEDPPSSDPRARAARTKRDRTRRALLDAADAAFGSRGWAATRMEDVAVGAGVSLATTYNHFPTKHVLVAELFGPLLRPLLLQAERDAGAGRDAADALDDQVRELARLGARHRMLTSAFSCAVQDYAVRVGGPPDPRDPLDPRALAPVGDALRVLVEHGQRTGELARYPSARDASGVVADLLLLRAVNCPHDPPETTARLLLTVLFGMLRADRLPVR